MANQLIFTVLFSLMFFCEAMPNYDEKLSDVFFDGGYVFFPVKQAKLQQHLDKINSQFSNEIDELFLPTEPVLQDVIGSDEHVIMVVFGSMDAVAFDDALTSAEKQTESTKIEALSIAIPYLTTKNGEEEDITFQMKLFTSEGGHHIESNVVLPTPIVADHLMRTKTEHFTDFAFAKDDLHLLLVGTHQHDCEAHGEEDIEDVEEYEHELQISLDGPDFSICDQFPHLQVDLCDVYRDTLYNSVLEQAGNNVCQYWVQTEDVETCDSTFDVLIMSPAMKDLLMLDDDHQVIEGVFQSGTFDIRLVFPCVE